MYTKYKGRIIMKKNDKPNAKKRSTDDLINDAISKQNDWLENRREYTRGFLKSLNMFAKPADKNKAVADKAQSTEKSEQRARGVLGNFWFPISCVVFVVALVVWTVFLRPVPTSHILIVPENIPTPVIRKVEKITVPEFDIVRIDKTGHVVIAGRWTPNKNISVMVNGKIIATELTNEYGEFVYSSKNKWNAGNYTIVLVGADPEIKSDNKVFVYVSEKGADNSVSLLMTKDGSTLLQAPAMLYDGDLAISKIDYLSGGRIVVTGDSLPRLRVSLSLNGKYMGFARVSDHKHFGLGADVGELESGKEYELTVRLHDGDGRTISSVSHKFFMPEMTGDDDTYYTVRRGDCLWIIARNFLRRGILFSIIAERNNIENPDLIFPEQVLQIPVGAK